MIQNSSVLVDLNLSVWTGRKMDKKTSDEVVAAKSARSKNAASVSKHLLAGNDTLTRIQKHAANIRNWHYEQTLPWSDGGSRLLPMKSFFDYKARLGEFEQEFDSMIEEFVREYPVLVSAAAFQLGDLFDRSEYPEVETIQDRFRFKYVFLPVPEMGDFRVDVGTEAKVELQAQYDKFYQTKLDDAMKDMWDRLHDSLSKLSERLDYSDDGVKKVFRDTLVTNALDVCSMLSNLNVTNDPKLEDARRKLEQTLSGIEATDLRESPALRNDVKTRVDNILKSFDF
jgi:hypothetical protein